MFGCWLQRAKNALTHADPKLCQAGSYSNEAGLPDHGAAMETYWSSDVEHRGLKQECCLLRLDPDKYYWPQPSQQLHWYSFSRLVWREDRS